MRLYVNNLSYAMTEQGLRDEFAEHGTVHSCQIPLDQRTKLHQGFGYVIMPLDSEAVTAIEALNGATLGGKTIEVRESRQKKKPASSAQPRTAESRFGNIPIPKSRVNRSVILKTRKSQDR